MINFKIHLKKKKYSRKEVRDLINEIVLTINEELSNPDNIDDSEKLDNKHAKNKAEEKNDGGCIDSTCIYNTTIENLHLSLNPLFEDINGRVADVNNEYEQNELEMLENDGTVLFEQFMQNLSNIIIRYKRLVQ